jgi:predicted enzyme related to lactoylglutathione lyase
VAPAQIWKSTLDCNDMEGTTAFWTWLLGVEVLSDTDEFRFLGPPGGQPVMSLQRVQEPRSGKSRMHLDLLAEDLEAVVEQVEQHGGAKLAGPNELPAGRWFVMVDPEGNEFCVVMLVS